jgi:RNA-directed DNA polymerase
MKTRRSNGNSLEYIITDVNITLKGWFNYFQHSNKWSLLDIDRWVRMRLRSILRKRAGLKGRGRGRDHQRWTNDFFAQAGLFSMMAAWTKASQSVKR